MGWVCREVVALTDRRSTTLRGSPVFFPTTCILLHHVVGVFDGTLSKMPSSMSRSRSLRTCSTQWAGIVDGLCIAIGVAFSFTCMRSGGKPVILGRGWCVHTLNADAEYVSRIQASIRGMLAGVSGKGGDVGGGGGGHLFRQPHGANSLPFTSYCTCERSWCCL